MRVFALVAATIVVLASSQVARADFDDRPGWQRAGYTALAGVENVVPIVSAVGAPRCLQGYILCKLTFAGLSVVTAAEHLLFTGGSDMAQTEAVIHRGFAGDWILTPRHAAGDAEPQVLPDPVPVSSSGSGN
jgi:hypothetical protein